MITEKTMIDILEPLGVPVYPLICTDTELPNEYIVFVTVDNAPLACGGDVDELSTVQMRTAWYSRAGNAADKSRKMRKALRAAGFTIVDTPSPGYDNTTHHYIAYVEAVIDTDCIDD